MTIIDVFHEPDIEKIPIHAFCRDCGGLIRTTYSRNMFARHSYWDICEDCSSGKKGGHRIDGLEQNRE